MLQQRKKRGRKFAEKTRHSRPAVVGEKKKRCGSKDSKICKRLLHVWVLCVHGRLMLFFEKG